MLENSKAKVKIDRPVLFSIELAKDCQLLIDGNRGFFKPEMQENFIINQGRKGQDNDKISQPLAEEVAKNIIESDQVVIFDCWTKGGKNNSRWSTAYIIDESGIRMSIMISNFWKKDKAPSAPYSRANWHDSKARREEKNAGELKANYTWVEKIAIMFKRLQTKPKTGR